MKKRILVRAPALSRSGYGEQSRFALRALRSREDLFDIFLINIPWGNTGEISGNDKDRKWIEELIYKTVPNTNIPPDLSLQITIPIEFGKMAPINIGYTAGIETTKVAPEWLSKSNEMVDKIITISKHSKAVFENTKYRAQNDQTGEVVEDYGLQVPIDVVSYSVRNFEPAPVDIKLSTDKNFLVVSQWGPRKNLENTIKWFVEEFREDEDVGLILKTNTVAESIIDRELTTKRLDGLLSHCGEKKCKVYLVHGDLSPEELTWFYQHPTMKALINIGHGEGFGLPLFEAAYNGLPLVTITWSGQMDFICKPNKKGKQVPLVARVDYDLQPVQEEAVWPGVVIKESSWAYARETSYKRAIREILEKETHCKKRALVLQKHILKTFTEEAAINTFVDLLFTKEELDITNQIEEMFKDLSV